MSKKDQSKGDFTVFIVEDDEWYSDLLSYVVSLNPEYRVKRFGGVMNSSGNSMNNRM